MMCAGQNGESVIGCGRGCVRGLSTRVNSRNGYQAIAQHTCGELLRILVQRTDDQVVPGMVEPRHWLHLRSVAVAHGGGQRLPQAQVFDALAPAIENVAQEPGDRMGHSVQNRGRCLTQAG